MAPEALPDLLFACPLAVEIRDDQRRIPKARTGSTPCVLIHAAVSSSPVVQRASRTCPCNRERRHRCGGGLGAAAFAPGEVDSEEAHEDAIIPRNAAPWTSRRGRQADYRFGRISRAEARRARDRSPLPLRARTGVCASMRRRYSHANHQRPQSVTGCPRGWRCSVPPRLQRGRHGRARRGARAGSPGAAPRPAVSVGLHQLQYVMELRGLELPPVGRQRTLDRLRGLGRDVADLPKPRGRSGSLPSQSGSRKTFGSKAVAPRLSTSRFPSDASPAWRAC